MGVFANVPLVVDTSALVRWRHFPPPLAAAFRQANAQGEFVTSSVVLLEFLHDAYDVQVFDNRRHAFSQLVELPVTPDDCATAIQAMDDLAHLPPIKQGYHKVAAPDALIAASAVANGCGVLHYDHDYERLAEVIPNLIEVPIAAFGSLP